MTGREPMHPTLAELTGLLDLEAIERNLFRGTHPKGRKARLYGGQIMAQALMAAGRTLAAGRLPHSLHGYFLRPGDPSVPVLFTVDRIRDGRSFTTRRVVAIQHGEAIFNMSASFQVAEEGLDHQIQAPDLTPPDASQIPASLQKQAFLAWNLEFREKLKNKPMAPRQHNWFRANGVIESDDPLLHTALLVYQSDDSLLSTARLPHLGRFEREHLQRASLDHAMWFHEKVRVDQWLLYVLDAPRASAARGFNRGLIYTADGRLVASTAQEGLMRIREETD